jgi:hypothetical protein
MTKICFDEKYFPTWSNNQVDEYFCKILNDSSFVFISLNKSNILRNMDKYILLN